jgi:uncharacterized coiled-coil protein SlyX
MAKDQKQIDRLKQDLKVQRITLEDLRAVVAAQNNQLKQAETIIRNMVDEQLTARNFFWAVVHSQGGRISVPDWSMTIAGDPQNFIRSYRDTKSQATTFEALTKTEPVSKGGKEAPPQTPPSL